MKNVLEIILLGILTLLLLASVEATEQIKQNCNWLDRQRFPYQCIFNAPKK